MKWFVLNAFLCVSFLDIGICVDWAPASDSTYSTVAQISAWDNKKELVPGKSTRIRRQSQVSKSPEVIDQDSIPFNYTESNPLKSNPKEDSKKKKRHGFMKKKKTKGDEKGPLDSTESGSDSSDTEIGKKKGKEKIKSKGKKKDKNDKEVGSDGSGPEVSTDDDNTSSVKEGNIDSLPLKDKRDVLPKEKRDSLSKDRTTSRERRDSTSRERRDSTSRERRDSTSRERRDSTSREKKDSTVKEKKDTSKEKKDTTSKEKKDVSKDKKESTSKERRGSLLKEKRDSLSKEAKVKNDLMKDQVEGADQQDVTEKSSPTSVPASDVMAVMLDSAANFQSVKPEEDLASKLRDAGNNLVVIDFFAKWCGPCKMISPKIEELAKEYPDVVFLKVDVDECEEIATEYDITSMPTFVFVKNGSTLTTFSGANFDKLKETLLKHK